MGCVKIHLEVLSFICQHFKLCLYSVFLLNSTVFFLISVIAFRHEYKNINIMMIQYGRNAYQGMVILLFSSHEY